MKPHIWFYKGMWGVSRYRGDIYRWEAKTIEDAWAWYQLSYVPKAAV